MGILGAVPEGHEQKAMKAHLHYRICPTVLTDSSAQALERLSILIPSDTNSARHLTHCVASLPSLTAFVARVHPYLWTEDRLLPHSPNTSDCPDAAHCFPEHRSASNKNSNEYFKNQVLCHRNLASPHTSSKRQPPAKPPSQNPRVSVAYHARSSLSILHPSFSFGTRLFG